MKCYQCQSSIPDDAAVCPFCRAPQGFDAGLVERAAANDQEAIAELYERTYSSVYHTIKSMVKDDDTALDILQDSYLKAFRSLDKLEDPSKFRAWIKRIAHNQTVDALRQTRTVTFSDLESEDADTPLDFEDTCEAHLPEAVIDRQETERLMREILDSLPEEQRVVIGMFYYEQYSVKEIAEELGVSENTVKSRLNYGRKKVEKEVRALEKKGTKLYGLTPIPFLMLLFRSQEAYAAGIPAASVLESISAGLAAETMAGTAAGAAASAASAAGAASGAAGSTAGSAASAVGNAAVKTAAKAAGHALRTRLLAGAAALAIVGGGGAALYQHLQDRAETTQAVTESTEEEQVLPDSFLKEMDVLAQEKLATALSDNEYLELVGESGTTDIPVQYITYFKQFSANGPQKTVFYETGGAAMYYLVYIGHVHIDVDWAKSIAVPIPPTYEDAMLVLVLDSFPLKFLHEDGSIEYKKDDMCFYRIYTSMEAFDAEIEEMGRYVDHRLYEFAKPPEFYWQTEN